MHPNIQVPFIPGANTPYQAERFVPIAQVVHRLAAAERLFPLWDHRHLHCRRSPETQHACPLKNFCQ